MQVGPQLVEEAPQELRSRLWLALIDNPQLCHTYDDGKVQCSVHMMHDPKFHVAVSNLSLSRMGNVLRICGDCIVMYSSTRRSAILHVLWSEA